MLHLEFSFVCCIGYKKNGDSWEEIVTPFHEWAEYLRFLKNTEVRPIQNVEGVVSKRPHEFSFVEDLSVLLEEAKKQPISIEVGLDGFNLPSEEVIFSLPFIDLNKSPDFYRPYIHNLIEKLSLLRLAEVSQKKLQITDLALNWLGMKLADKSLYFYRHPLNRILNKKVSQSICTEKAMREGEKSITRVLNKEWVFFDDFFQGIISPINEESIITLKRTGKSWRYALPNYSPGEKEFLRSIVLEWLFEAALVQVGSYEGRECFRVTTLGKTLFGR